MITLFLINRFKGFIPHIAFMLFNAVLLCGCIDEQIIPPNNKETTITFSVSVPNDFSPTGYALSETEEKTVSTIDVLLFDSSSKDFVSGPHRGVVSESGNRITVSILVAAGNYDMVVFANCRDEVSAVAASGQKKDDVLASDALRKSVTVGDVDADGGTTLVGGTDAGWLTSEGNKTIPMHGETTVDVSSNSVVVGSAVNLVRMLARINVTNAAVSTFTFSDVYICNYNSAGRIARAGTWTTSNPSAVSSVQQTGHTKAIKYAASENKIERDIYAFEAAAGAIDDLGNPCLIVRGTYDGAINYYRIDFVDGEQFQPLLRNYTYNVGITQIEGKGYSSIKDALEARPVNISYTVSSLSNAQIGGVVTDGQYKLSVSAYSLNFDAAGRTLDSEDNTITIACNYGSTVTISNITSDGDWLSVYNSEKNILHNNDAIALSYGSASIFLVFSDNYSGVKAPRTGSFVLTAGRMSYVVNVSQSNQGTEIITKIPEPEANCYIVPPLGAILIPVSRANASDEIGIQLNDGDAFAAELVWTDNSNGIAPNSNIKTIVSVGTGGSGYVYVETGSAEGNVVVGIRKKNAEGKAEGGFLWSWHIWVTTYNPNNIVPVNGYFMDRNLGATNTIAGDIGTIGLHYQWGRKDPFPTTSSFESGGVRTLYFGQDVYSQSGIDRLGEIKTVDINNDNIQSSSTYPPVSGYSQDNNLGYAVSNPHIFYYSYNSNVWDWFINNGGAKNDFLWGGDNNSYSNSQSKTVYDPCPNGWRVPTCSHWTSALGNNTGHVNTNEVLDTGWRAFTDNGRIVSSGTWATDPSLYGYWPAAGLRGSNSGNFENVGSIGFYWSASPTGNNGRVLTFNSSALNSPGTDWHFRASGISVRCVMDSAWDVIIEDSSNTSLVDGELSFKDFDGKLPAAQTINLQAPHGALVVWSGNDNFNISGPSITTSTSTSYSVQPKVAIIGLTTYSNIVTSKVIHSGKEISQTFILKQSTCAFDDIQPESNSYIVAPNKTVLIPVSRANASGEIGIQLNEDDAFTAELVWTDNTNGIVSNSNIKTITPVDVGVGGYVYVETGSAEGNAVVGIRKKNSEGNAEGGFLWSWHIWVTTYNPSQPAEGYFMDRNLGATSAAAGDAGAIGLQYQWGRKDPFPASSVLESNSELGLYFGRADYGRSSQPNQIKRLNNVNISYPANSTYPPTSDYSQGNILGYSISNPHILYFSTSTNDWYITNGGIQNDNLWEENNDSKTVYDPCPTGWRVPSLYQWATALNENFYDTSNPSSVGWIWGHSGMTASSEGDWVGHQIAGAYFPAAGYRNASKGELTNVGLSGYYWSSSPIGVGARDFSFGEDFLYSVGYGLSGRAMAASVRCISESVKD